MPISTAAPWQCGVCGTLYRAWLSRCQRCHGPGPTEEDPLMPKTTRAVGPTIDGEPVVAQGGGEVEQPVAVGVPAAPPDEPATGAADSEDVEDPAGAEVTGTEDTGSEQGRPPVNAAKAEHAAYAAATYGNDPGWWDDEYSKRGLIAELDKLAAGDRVMVDGAVVDPSLVGDPEPPQADHEPDPAPDGDGDGAAPTDDPV